MKNDRRHLPKHIPPHERRSMLQLEFSERDWYILKEVFMDEDTTEAVVEIIRDAPPEIQILAFQLIHMIEEVA